MSEVNLGQTEQPKTEQPKTEQLPPPAKYNEKTVIGDYLPGFADLRLPRINVVHGIGQLKDNFAVGSLVYNQQFELFAPKQGKHEATPPVEMVILGWLPLRYAEKVTEGRGMLVSSEEEVRRAGGTLDYAEWQAKKENGMRRFEPLMEAVVLARQPEFLKEDDANFPFSIDGARYLLALLPMKGMTYNNTAKGLFTLRQLGCLREHGYPSYSFMVSVEWKATRIADRGSFIPVFKPNKKTSEAFQKFARELVSGPPPEAPEAAEPAE
jgi:hypothetical protein